MNYLRKMKAEEGYAHIVIEENGRIQKLTKQINGIVSLRILSFMLVAGTIYLTFANSAWFGWLSLVFIGVFLWLVKRHNAFSLERKRRREIKKIAEMELIALRGDHSGFPAPPAIKGDHPFAYDLDLFHGDSIYRLLNRARTPDGIATVTRQLLEAPVGVTEMQQWHEAITALSDKHRHRVSTQAAASLTDVKAEQLEGIKAWSKESAVWSSDKLKWLLRLAPFYTVLVLGLYGMDLIPESLMILAFLLPLGVVGANIKRTGEVYEQIGKHAQVFEGYSFLIEHILEAPLSKLTDEVRGELQEASNAFKELAKILSNFDQRNNFIVAILTNAFFLSELRNCMKVLKWKEKHGQNLVAWFEAIGKYELLISLATFHANHEEDLSFPSAMPDGQQGVKAQSVKHPLLLHQKVVANDIGIHDPNRILIITGANMAGKSTYLRTIGVNVLLARMGSPVAAKDFELSDLRLFTSMRTSDSLDSGTSYFMAELKRLAQLMDQTKDSTPVLALLDEILKGTNSLDKEQGSRSFVKRLLQHPVYAVVATHDVSLCTLKEEHRQEVENYHFASEVRGEDLYFDYKLHDGVCDTMNATWLMKSMGLID